MPLEKLEKSSLPSPYEFLLDRVAEALIESRYVDTSVVENNQKFILDGQLQVGNEVIIWILYQLQIEIFELYIQLHFWFNYSF